MVTLSVVVHRDDVAPAGVTIALNRGRDEYLKDVESIKARYEHVRARGNDRPLVFPSWDLRAFFDRWIYK